MNLKKHTALFAVGYPSQNKRCESINIIILLTVLNKHEGLCNCNIELSNVLLKIRNNHIAWELGEREYSSENVETTCTESNKAHINCETRRIKRGVVALCTSYCKIKKGILNHKMRISLPSYMSLQNIRQYYNHNGIQ